MTRDDLITLICTNTARDVLSHLARIPQPDRRPPAKAVAALYDTRVLFSYREAPSPLPKPMDPDAVIIGLLATASLGELKKLGYVPFPNSIAIEEVFGALKPDWIQGLVDFLVAENPRYVGRIAGLWKAGLCDRPESDALILGYYSGASWTVPEIEEEGLLAGDVWRFFEVEGGGEFSLANHDKFAGGSANTWSERLVAYANDGRIDRQRLLDASLDALERDFGQYAAGWYSRFHRSLAPTADETAARADRYLRLLASSVPPTVSFAMKHVQALDKTGALDPHEAVVRLEPALTARSKSTVVAALRLLSRAAARDKNLRQLAARQAVFALLSGDAGVQSKTLDVIEAVGDFTDDALRASIADYVDLVAPSVRSRLAALVRIEPPSAASDTAPAPITATPVTPVASVQEALALYLSVLEAPRDPCDVERAVDGLSRFGAVIKAHPTALSPLRKRAAQLCKTPGNCQVRLVLALTARALAEERTVDAILLEVEDANPYACLRDTGLQDVHRDRNAELVERVADGIALPMLSCPSESSGTVSIVDLISRMSDYRAAGVSPGTNDLALALMRLSAKGRVPPSDLPTWTEADRALAYALGREVPVGPTPELWAAAWSARRSGAEDAQVMALFPKPMPDCGTPARMSFGIEKLTHRDGSHDARVDVAVLPVVGTPRTGWARRQEPQADGFAWTMQHCGDTFADVAWASLLRPTDPDAFFRKGILCQDVWQKLTDNHTRAYIEPIFRPGPKVGPIGAAMLAYFMACEDKSVTALAAEAAAVALTTSRMTPARFAAALKELLLSQLLPTARWTKGLAAMAQAGAQDDVRDVIIRILNFAPNETPRDLGGMLELCYELHVASGSKVTDPIAIDCLRAMPGGGKIATFSKKLIDLSYAHA